MRASVNIANHMANNVIKKRITFIWEHYAGYYNQLAGMSF